MTAWHIMFSGGIRMVASRIGEKVREIREGMNLSQKQMADYLGLDQSAVSKYESGERSMSTVTLEKICNLLGCMPEELLSDEGARTEKKVAFRATDIDAEDLEALASVQRISMNIALMKRALSGKN